MRKYDAQGALSQIWSDLFPGSKVDWDKLTADGWDEMYQRFRATKNTGDLHKYRADCEEHERRIAELEDKLAQYDEEAAAEQRLKAAGVKQEDIDLLKGKKKRRKK